MLAGDLVVATLPILVPCGNFLALGFPSRLTSGFVSTILIFVYFSSLSVLLLLNFGHALFAAILVFLFLLTVETSVLKTNLCCLHPLILGLFFGDVADPLLLNPEILRRLPDRLRLDSLLLRFVLLHLPDLLILVMI